MELTVINTISCYNFDMVMGMLGSEIKKARQKQGLTQQELGDLIGVSKSSINYFEKDDRNPTLDHLLKLSKVLNLPIELLLGLDQQVNIVAENEEYQTRISSKDMQILNELKLYPALYRRLCDDTKRTVKLINFRLK